MNPWFGIAILVGFIVAAVGGYRHGYDKATGDVSKQNEKARVVVIENHNKLTEADVKAAQRAEARRWQKRLNEMEKRHALEQDLVRRQPPAECRSACDLDATSLELLRDSIREANNRSKTVDPGSRGDEVPAPAGAGKRGVGDGPAVSF